MKTTNRNNLYPLLKLNIIKSKTNNPMLKWTEYKHKPFLSIHNKLTTQPINPHHNQINKPSHNQINKPSPRPNNKPKKPDKWPNKHEDKHRPTEKVETNKKTNN